MEGLGDHLHHEITTSSPRAQQYFDQGLRLVYAFNHDEAQRAFEEAARLDPNASMAWWGIALVLGPNYNLPADPERDRAAWRAVEKAQAAAAAHGTQKERDYAAAIAARYAPEPQTPRTHLDEAYASAMRELARKHPDDLDAQVLFAESLMTLHPWDLWTREGEPKHDTPEIVATLESVLARDPNHPGANHYYIHAVEASKSPERATASAARLGKLTPNAGHLVHMPAHVYMRTGRYADAVAVNETAAAVDERYIESRQVTGVYPAMYYPHNVHFIAAAAAMAGKSAQALEAAAKVESIALAAVKDMPMAEYFTPTRVFVLVRFGRWQEILREPAPPAHVPYMVGVWHYARGLACLRTGDAPGVARELAALEALRDATPPDRLANLNSMQGLFSIAADTLRGETAAANLDTPAAVAALERAVARQDQLIYDEPPPWYHPVRQTLAQVLLDAGRAADAEQVYRADLAENPENGWSLYGLAKALRAQKKDAEAKAVEARFAAAWAQADVVLAGSRF
jgi:predicted Zn-dependent protease